MHLSLRRRQELPKAKAKPGQSCCSAGQQPQGPRPQQPAAKQSHGQKERQGQGCAAFTCPSPRPVPTHGHHHAWSKRTEHPPAHRASPSRRLQRHSTLQPPRSTLGLMTDTTHSRNTPLVTRVSHPSPQATSSTSPGWHAQHCTHSLDC